MQMPQPQPLTPFAWTNGSLLYREKPHVAEFTQKNFDCFQYGAHEKLTASVAMPQKTWRVRVGMGVV